MGQKKVITKTEAPKEGAQIKAPVSDSTETQLRTGPPSGKKSSKKQVINGVAYITVSYNNTRVSIADTKGGIIAWTSAGSLGFKGTKKSTPYAANLIAKTCVEKARKYNLSSVRIVVRGVGPGRESAIRGLAGTGLTITAITDKTPIAHNGVRSKKPRRV